MKVFISLDFVAVTLVAGGSISGLFLLFKYKSCSTLFYHLKRNILPTIGSIVALGDRVMMLVLSRAHTCTYSQL